MPRSLCHAFLHPPLPDDPRRPFPQDIEMRSGHLGRLTSGQEAVIGSKVNGGSTAVSARMQITGEYVYE